MPSMQEYTTFLRMLQPEASRILSRSEQGQERYKYILISDAMLHVEANRRTRMTGLQISAPARWTRDCQAAGRPVHAAGLSRVTDGIGFISWEEHDAEKS